MTRLFQILTNCGLEFDASNDNLSLTDWGMVWECPVTNIHLASPLQLAATATDLLGAEFRGFELVFADPASEQLGDLVRIFLTSSYED